MLTTCPECRTTFRVVREQLESRCGLVRCGYCRAVFNAYDTLLPEFEAPLSAAVDENPPADIPIDGLPPEAVVEPVVEPTPAEPAAIPEADEEPMPHETHGPEPADDDTFAVLGGEIPRLDAYRPEPDSPLPMLRPDETPDAILLSDLPTRDRIEPERRLWKPVLFGLLSLLLALTLLGQLAYWLRGPIVEWLPEARPTFEQACRNLDCRIPLSRQLEQIKVESSALESDPEQPNRVKLKVDFSNRSQVVQAWPCFILRLSDLRGSSLARRVFWPKDYLPKTKRESAGMAAMSEMEFQLDLDLGGLSAAGYEVKPLYP
ncbi:MAG: hypothetical protein COW23_05195 [Hydrogenophilales bacterium CG15_BIG_FIL_POST_REV_8_21_14_020_62_31]|nr:MAG: hypothetical protein COW23_05195 [Hydrogenophilales bacterium CG15_BIG_FIL_POST_REV_8_21_14_020_62_31]PIW71603.1 MAG: hypothetical protein COW07_07405 [Hydrogenophilales bacterium CG12_big_fil_rev_8_21_14_0_65_61_21]